LANVVSSAVEEQPLKGVVDAQVLAESLTRRGFSVRVRRAVGGGEGSTCLHNLRHTFLICHGLDNQSTPIYVDPSFAEQFQIAKVRRRPIDGTGATDSH
jgi:integrase